MSPIVSGGGGGSQPVLETTVNITSAQIKALFTTPITLVAAPGAGQWIDVARVATQLIFGTTPYTDPDSNLNVFYAGDAGNGSLVGSPLAEAASAVVASVESIDAPRAQTLVANKALLIGSPATNPSLGDGTLRVTTLYAVIALG